MRISGSTWLTTTTEPSSSSMGVDDAEHLVLGRAVLPTEAQARLRVQRELGNRPAVLDDLDPPRCRARERSGRRSPGEASHPAPATTTTESPRSLIARRIGGTVEGTVARTSSTLPSRYGTRAKRTRAARHTSSESRVVP